MDTKTTAPPLPSNHSSANSTAVLGLSPSVLLPSALLHRVESLLAGYVSQGTVGLIAFGLVVMAMLLCARRVVPRTAASSAY